MHRELPPIAKCARRVLMIIEEAVSRFPRRHRYTLGADLRRETMQVCRCVHRAWRERNRQLARVHELVIALDDLKVSLQLGKDVNAFVSFAQFEMIAREVSDLGRQVGGWLRALHSKGQNGSEPAAPGQRAPILSSRTASHEAQL